MSTKKYILRSSLDIFGPILYSMTIVDIFDGPKPRFLNRSKKRRSVSTLRASTELRRMSIPRALYRGAEGLIRYLDF